MPDAPSVPTAASAGGQPAGRSLVRFGLVVCAAVVLLDQATKVLAVRALTRGRMIDVLGDGWGLQLIYNDGGVFGLPAPWWFFLAVTVVVAAVVFRNLPRAGSPGVATAYGLLLAGALGNALDRVLRVGDPDDPRFLHGHVVDFLAVELPLLGSFPRFNVADVALNLGVVVLLLALWREERRTPG